MTVRKHIDRIGLSFSCEVECPIIRQYVYVKFVRIYDKMLTRVILCGNIKASLELEGSGNMLKFFCSTKDKEVKIQTDQKNASTLEDVSIQLIPGRKTCMENKNGNCFEFENCPLIHK